jgi:hypothetical protein
MKVYEPAVRTSVATIRQYGEIADRGGDPGAAAQAWTNAGFDDKMTAAAARALADMGVAPEQAARRTRDGGGGYVDTIAYKVANGDLTARQGAARTLSSR